MAGDWIKMRGDLTDDPAVIAIADATRLDAYAVVGRLHKLWSWADSHTTDGAILGVGLKWVDMFLGKPGFSSAMCGAGWLEVTPQGISFPHFERHNGATGKARSMSSKRQQMSRSRHAIDDETVTQVSRSDRDKNVTREEKSREEKSKDQKQEQGADAPRLARKRRLPDDWQLPDDWRDWATAERSEWDLKTLLRVSLEFRDHWLGLGEARSDWSATWRNWVRRERGIARAPPRQESLADRRTAAVDQLTGQKRNGRDITGTAERMDTSDFLAIPGDVWQPDGDDVGRG